MTGDGGDITRLHDRPATLVAFVKALTVYLLPLELVGAIALVAPAYTNGSTHVVGVDPDRTAVGLGAGTSSPATSWASRRSRWRRRGGRSCTPGGGGTPVREAGKESLKGRRAGSPVQ